MMNDQGQLSRQGQVSRPGFAAALAVFGLVILPWLLSLALFAGPAETLERGDGGDREKVEQSARGEKDAQDGQAETPSATGNLRSETGARRQSAIGNLKSEMEGLAARTMLALFAGGGLLCVGLVAAWASSETVRRRWRLEYVAPRPPPAVQLVDLALAFGAVELLTPLLVVLLAPHGVVAFGVARAPFSPVRLAVILGVQLLVYVLAIAMVVHLARLRARHADTGTREQEGTETQVSVDSVDSAQAENGVKGEKDVEGENGTGSLEATTHSASDSLEPGTDEDRQSPIADLEPRTDEDRQPAIGNLEPGMDVVRQSPIAGAESPRIADGAAGIWPFWETPGAKLPRDVAGDVRQGVTAFVLLFWVLTVATMANQVALQALNLAPDSNPVLEVLKRETAGPDRAWLLVLLSLATVVGAAISEEVLFRGILYSVLRLHLDRGTAAVAAALLFSFRHGVLGNLWALFLLGLILTWLYERTGRLLAPIVFHAVNNLVALGLTWLAASS